LTTKTRAPRARLWLAALAASLIAAAGLAATPTAAFAATTPPTVDKVGSSHNLNTTSVTLTTSFSEEWVAFVSADGPSNAAQTVTVTVGGTSWTLQTSSSYQSGAFAPGYSGVFSTGSNLSSGTKTVSASLTGATGYNLFLEVITFKGASGIGGVSSNGSNAGYPNVPFIAVTGGNSLEYAVGHDWDNASTPTVWTGNPPQTMDNYWLDTNGDTDWVQHLTAATTSQQSGNLGLSTSYGDHANMSAVEVLGT
jgi:hypothetical protein